MPALELAYWAEFERDFGPLTVQERIDGLIRTTMVAGNMEPPLRIWWKPVRWTDDQLFTWLDAEARKN